MNNYTFSFLGAFCLIFCLGFQNSTWAQEVVPEKSVKEKKIKAAKDGNASAAIVAQVSGLTREEKNTMTRCPIHNKHMSLSNNYRANASDFTISDAYPFSYQLNYRRYCSKCSRIMSKEAQFFVAQDRSVNGGKATFERCGIHNTALVSNPDYDKNNYEKNPSSDMPHAKQYLFKNCCKICSKVFKIQQK